MCQLTDDAKSPGDQDAPEDAAFYIFGKKNSGDEDSDQCQEDSDSLGMESSVSHRGLKGKNTYQSGIIVYYDFCILEPDKGNKKSDTYRHCMLQVHWNGIEDRFTYIGQ